MKHLIFLLCLVLSMQNGYGQACGVYFIKYVGNIEAEAFKIEQVDLPSIWFLEGDFEEEESLSWVDIKPKENLIEAVSMSSLRSVPVNKDIDAYVQLYKSNLPTLPIILTVKEKGQEQKIKLALNWGEIELKWSEEDRGMPLLELDLKTITIDH